MKQGAWVRVVVRPLARVVVRVVVRAGWKSPRAKAGMSLLECLFAVAIMGVLAAMAMPMQHSGWQRSQRALARSALVQSSTWVERELTLRGAMPGTLPDGAPWMEGLSYRLSLELVNGDHLVRAVPVGRQADDSCGELWLSRAGQRGAGGRPSGCW